MLKTVTSTLFIFLFVLSCGKLYQEDIETLSRDDNNVTENKKNTFIYNAIQDDPSASISPGYSIAINTFSINLLKEIYCGRTGQNLVLSPYSLNRNLAVLTEGTTGESKDELLNAIGGQYALDDAKDALSELLYADNSVLLQIADAFWFDSRYYSIQAGFSDMIKNKYGVGISGLDFGNASQTSGTINGWISDNTNSVIPSMVTVKNVQEAVFFITSAVYFKADWTSPFDVTKTEKGVFHSPDGDIQTDMMTSEYSYKTCITETYENVKIYYGADNTDFFYLDIYMPVDNSIENFLSDESLTALASQPEYTSRKLSMPGFEFETEIDLIPVLKNMGVTGIFDQYKGDITGILNETNNIFINMILQKSGIKADEEGTVAYSATVTSAGNTSTGPEETIILDHPFVYFIRAGQNGLVLFAGVVNNPNESK